MQNVWGWAWSSTIGWVHFGSAPGEAPTNYRVTHDTASGALGGYAWSSNIGWVHAAPTSGYPEAPAKGATVNASGVVEGWMRITAIANASASEAGGWNGWIKMSGSNYGVALNQKTGVFTGFAWSPEIGWIAFNPTYGGVFTSGNQAPMKPSLTNPIGDNDLYMIPGWEADPVAPHFEWSAFSDADVGDAQTAYEIEIQGVAQRHTSAANTCLYRGFDPCFGSIADLAWNTQYRWRVRVFDRANETSPWSDYGLFRTPNHRRPIADFTLPNQPKASVNLQFVEQSSCYQFSAPTSPVPCRSLSGITYQWNFGDCAVSPSTCTSTERDPQHKYSRAGVYVVTLTVTDQDGYVSDPKQQQITIGQELPGWERITPF
ncbi:PKD domain-containing protein [Candidatus Uhrbacteria bacterium]|nr:PKD domain-containing protein [Candidatus Uhrbacteria bacterium]